MAESAAEHLFVLIDDHELFRFGIELIVERHFPTARVISVDSLERAFAQIAQSPSLVLLDYKLQGASEAQALALTMARWPQAQVVIVTAEPGVAISGLGDREGIPVVSKAASPQVLTDIIRALLPDAVSAGGGRGPAALSRRQIEVLRHLREGHSNKAIARMMDLSEFTVRGHIRELLKATGASNRTNAVFLAEQAGML